MVVPRAVDRREVQRLLAEGAQLVDVRDAEDYAGSHIAGAISLPLNELTREKAHAVLDPARPVITHCHDFL